MALLRSFDPGKGWQRDARWDARRGKAVLGVDLPFDRGKHDGGHSMEGDGIRAEGEFFVLFDYNSVRENKWKNVCWETALFSLFSTGANHEGGGKVYCVQF